MNRSRWKLLLIACLLAVAPIGFLLGFSAHGAEAKKFTLGYSTVGPAGTGLWMAKEIGAFEKYGIDADLIFISAGPIVVQALVGGDLQAGLAATNAVTAAVMAGAPLVSEPVKNFGNRYSLRTGGSRRDG
jgi:ABC-type nitrate/sulfonate/bicarbonate transport system substrate-binding protein